MDHRVQLLLPDGNYQQQLIDHIEANPGFIKPTSRKNEVLGFLRKQAEGAKYVTSVCTGSLVLGAAGLLKGYRATTHWIAWTPGTSAGAAQA